MAMTLTLIRPHNHNRPPLGADAQILVQPPMALVVALVIEEDLMQVANVVLARKRVEDIGDLFELSLMALTVRHQDRLDQAVDVPALGREAQKRAFGGAEVVAELYRC